MVEWDSGGEDDEEWVFVLSEPKESSSGVADLFRLSVADKPSLSVVIPSLSSSCWYSDLHLY